MISFIVGLMGDDFCKWTSSEDVWVFGHDTRASKGLRAEHPTFGNISSLMAVEMSGQMIQAQKSVLCRKWKWWCLLIYFFKVVPFCGKQCKNIPIYAPHSKPGPQQVHLNSGALNCGLMERESDKVIVVALRIYSLPYCICAVWEVNVSVITLVPYTSLEETGLKDLRSIGSLGLRKQDAEMFCW